MKASISFFSAVLSTILGFSFSSLASPVISQDGTASIYQQVLGYFNQGTVPALAQVTGVYSGRCYVANSPNTPTAGILIGFSYTTGGDNGPLFPANPPIFKIVRAPSPDANQPSNAYDTMTPDTQNMVSQIVNGSMGNNDPTPATVQNGSLVSVNTGGDLSYAIREYDNYLFSKDTYVNDSGAFKAGDVFTACYFFKQIATSAQ